MTKSEDIFPKCNFEKLLQDLVSVHRLPNTHLGFYFESKGIWSGHGSKGRMVDIR